MSVYTCDMYRDIELQQSLATNLRSNSYLDTATVQSAWSDQQQKQLISY